MITCIQIRINRISSGPNSAICTFRVGEIMKPDVVHIATVGNKEYFGQVKCVTFSAAQLTTTILLKDLQVSQQEWESLKVSLINDLWKIEEEEKEVS